MSERVLGPAERLLTRAEVAALLHVSPKTVTRLQIPSVPVGKRVRRWRRVDVDRWIEERAA